MHDTVIDEKMSFWRTIKTIFQLDALPQLLLTAALLSIGLGSFAGLVSLIIYSRENTNINIHMEFY